MKHFLLVFGSSLILSGSLCVDVSADGPIPAPSRCDDIIDTASGTPVVVGCVASGTCPSPAPGTPGYCSVLNSTGHCSCQ